MARTFTLDEARMLLPVLSALLLRAREASERAHRFEVEMQQLSQRIFLSGGMHVDVPAAARRRAERDKAMQQARATIEEVEAIGVQISETEPELLEFPCVLEGRTVLLGWTLGDAEIERWREVNEDATTRRPVDARFSRTDRDRPN